MTEKKKFSTALLIWLFFGAIGGHKIYINERFHYLFWYWLLSLLTFGIAPIVSLFRIKGNIIKVNGGVV